MLVHRVAPVPEFILFASIDAEIAGGLRAPRDPDVLVEGIASCPFAGMTRIRFKGSPRCLLA
jgi:hypothetical protein